MVPARPQFDARSVPLPKHLKYTDEDGNVLCHLHAGRHVQRMVRAKVSGWQSFGEKEPCTACGKLV